MSKRHKISGMSFPGLDVVIPAWGGFDFLKSCLLALPDALGETKASVVVVDDFSEDAEGCKKVVAESPLPVTLLRNHENLGFGGACNRGSRACGSPLILFLNTDVTMFPGSIAKMVDFMRTHEDYGVVGPKLIFPEVAGLEGRPAGKIQHAGMEFNIRGEPIHIFMGWDRDHPKVQVGREVPAVTGASFMVRRKQFMEFGGFDPLWGRGTFEDVDYCFKVRSSGGHVHYLAEAEGYHVAGGSSALTQTPFPLAQNFSLFRARWGGMIAWTEWEVW